MRDASWVDRTEYPFESHYFEVEAGRLHYVDEGSGPAVVMVHGNPTWSFLYRRLIKRLSSQYRCIAVDHLGFGLSDVPRDWGYLPEQHAANLEALIDHLGLADITLVVQDWGGPIGLSYGVDHPDNVRRIVLMNTWAWPVDRDWYYIAFSGFMGGPVGRWLILRRNFFVNTVMPMAFGDKRKLTPTVHEQYRRALASPADRAGCAVLPKQIIASTPWLRRLWDEMGGLRRKPTLIVWGMKDIAFRAKELARWESLFDDARSLHLDEVGHYVQEEAPDELEDAILAFLA